MRRAKRKAAPRKLVCLETYRGDHQARAFRAPSVLPFFEGLARQLDPPLAIAHRHVGTLPQLAAYTRRREAILWRDPEAFDVPVQAAGRDSRIGASQASTATCIAARMRSAIAYPSGA
jgi:hypothetical protein